MVTKTKRTKSKKIEQVEQVEQEQKEQDASLIPAYKEIHRLLAYFRQDMDFKGIRLLPIIQTEGKRACYGHFTEAEIWKDRDDNGYHEIQISAEHLNRPYIDIAATIRHELLHAKNHEDGVKDTSNGGTYHNKNFLECATRYGIDCEEQNKKNGHGITKGFAAWFKAIFEQEFLPNDDAFTLVREKLAAKPKKKSKVKLHKFVCECQGNAGRFPKVETNATCDDCEEKFVHACDEC